MSRGGRRAGAGRPPSAGTPRVRRVEIRLAAHEYMEIVDALDRGGVKMTMSDWIRDAALERARKARIAGLITVLERAGRRPSDR